MSEYADIDARVAASEAIEALCRRLCEIDGYDPDMLFFRQNLLPLRLPGGQSFAVPDPMICRPAWWAYRPYAEAIFSPVPQKDHPNGKSSV